MMMSDISNREHTVSGNVGCRDENISQKYKSLVRYRLCNYLLTYLL